MKKKALRKMVVDLISLNAQLSDRVQDLQLECERKSRKIEEHEKELYELHCANDKRAMGLED